MNLKLREPKPALPGDIWLVYCDGSASPNPGNMGLGATLTAPDGTRHELSLPASGRGCNNEAEARAMMAALHHAKLLGVTALRLHCDSRVAVDQLMGDGTGKIARLQGLFEDLRVMLASFDQIELVWIPRHRNTGADALARAAAGLAPKPVARPAGKSRSKPAARLPRI